ncbi:MAG: redox-regulated ATPase YchF [Clostridiales bacterium]|jgi:GTP-binding protein YchF|nr:redox-regulated ATPase YchF [Clostridiales bacterium]
MKLGIVGLPNVGKSTLFNSLTKAGAAAANYPFCTIDPNIGMVAVPDYRINKLAALYNSEKITPAVIEFVDIAGLVKGASRGEGLGNKFLAHIREVDAIVHVVRCFEDSNVIHVSAGIDPLSDIETINLELIFSDLEIIERRASKTGKSVKADKSLQFELDTLEYLKGELEKGICARAIELDEKQSEVTKSLNLLTYKPVLYAANISEDELVSGENNIYTEKVIKLAEAEGSEVFTVCAKIEEEISELSEEEKNSFLQDLGVTESGLSKIITSGYKLLGLISYLTAGPKESRAWTIENGLKAPQAAGKIHTDFERGFIRAEIVNYDDLIRLGNYNAAKDAGLVRLEGKDYVVKDGDVILFRFNV